MTRVQGQAPGAKKRECCGEPRPHPMHPAFSVCVLPKEMHPHPLAPRHKRTRPLAPPQEQPSPSCTPEGDPVLREGCHLLQVTEGPWPPPRPPFW